DVPDRAAGAVAQLPDDLVLAVDDAPRPPRAGGSGGVAVAGEQRLQLGEGQLAPGVAEEDVGGRHGDGEVAVPAVAVAGAPGVLGAQPEAVAAATDDDELAHPRGPSLRLILPAEAGHLLHESLLGKHSRVGGGRSR